MAITDEEIQEIKAKAEADQDWRKVGMCVAALQPIIQPIEPTPREEGAPPPMPEELQMLARANEEAASRNRTREKYRARLEHERDREPLTYPVPPEKPRAPRADRLAAEETAKARDEAAHREYKARNPEQAGPLRAEPPAKIERVNQGPKVPPIRPVVSPEEPKKTNKPA